MIAVATDYSKLYQELEERWPIVATTAILLVAAFVLPELIRRDPLAGIPVVGGGRKGFMKKGGWTIYTEGYNKVCCDSGLLETLANTEPVQVWHLPHHDGEK